MSDLAGFLLVRIAEDEAVAQAAGGDRWHAAYSEYEEYDWKVGPARADGGMHRDIVTEEDAAAHIARWDPARVLAECDAKRLLLELHVPGKYAYPGNEKLVCMACSADGEYSPTQFDHTSGGFHDWPCPTLCALALPYAGHPDYRQEWKP